MMWT